MRRQDHSGPRRAAAGRPDGRTLPAAGDRADGRTDTGSDADLRGVLALGGVGLARDGAGLDLRRYGRRREAGSAGRKWSPRL